MNADKGLVALFTVGSLRPCAPCRSTPVVLAIGRIHRHALVHLAGLLGLVVDPVGNALDRRRLVHAARLRVDDLDVADAAVRHHREHRLDPAGDLLLAGPLRHLWPRRRQRHQLLAGEALAGAEAASPAAIAGAVTVAAAPGEAAEHAGAAQPQ